MGLSIGLINLEYRHDPPQPIPDFFRDLSSDPNISDYADFDDDESADGGNGAGYWCGTMDDVGILLVQRYELTERAENWCSEKNIPNAAREQLLTWLANLPWKDGLIRLHLVF